MTTPHASTRFADAFSVRKPILGMLHLKGEDPDDILDRAVREIHILIANGVDALVVEDYYGTISDVERVLARLASSRPTVPYGVNVLDDGIASFALADAYGAAFVQMDSIAGHLTNEEDGPFAQEIARVRDRSSAALLGGVRFKYQPVQSGNSVAVDLRTAMTRCDAVVVTGSGTGVETSLSKVQEFRDVLGSAFPLVVGAGVNTSNCRQALRISDGAIVGSSLKDTLTAAGEVSAANVAELMDAVRIVRTLEAGAAAEGSGNPR
jgi:predicted TIM-barrel enzyme